MTFDSLNVNKLSVLIVEQLRNYVIINDVPNDTNNLQN